MKTPRWIERVNENVIMRNVVLAACAIVVFVFLCSVMLNLFTRHGNHKEVPDFTEMEIGEVMRQARHASLRIEIIDSVYLSAYPGGTVLDQNPKPGAKVKAGRRIFVTTNSFHQREVDIPYVTGFSLRQAKNSLEVAGLEIEKLVYQPDIATNYVLEERFKGQAVTGSGKARAEIGSGITLVVGMGEDGTTTQVPKLVGFSLREAKSRLWEAGLNVGRIDRSDDITPLNLNEARVWGQSPEQGTHTILGQSVNFKLTLDREKTEKGSQASDHAARRIIQTQNEQTGQP